MTNERTYTPTVMMRVRIAERLSPQGRLLWENMTSSLRSNLANTVLDGSDLDGVIRFLEKEAQDVICANVTETNVRLDNARKGIAGELAGEYSRIWNELSDAMKRRYLDMVLDGVALACAAECFEDDCRRSRDMADQIDEERLEALAAETIE